MAVYVHHSRNGPDFEWDEGKIAGLLADVRFRQGQLLGRVEGMGTEFLAAAQERVRAFDTEIFTAASARKEFAQLLPEIAREFAAPLTRERILQWGSMLRPSSVATAAPKGAVHFQVSITGGAESKLVKLIHWVNSEAWIDPVLKAAIAHLWAVFAGSKDKDRDRLADIVTELLLARANQSGARLYSVAGQLETERHGYDEQMKLLQKKPLDATPWIEWFLGCVGRAIDNAGKMTKVILEKRRFWDRCAGMALNDRQRMVLSGLLEAQERKLTSSQWALLTKASQDTAGRDINDLVRRGVLVRQEGGGRSTSYMISPGV